MMPVRNRGEVYAIGITFKVFLIALAAVAGTLATLFEARGTVDFLLVALLPIEIAALFFSGRSLYRRHKDEAETIAETKAASVKVPCPNCSRENSVLTRICPRCDQKLQ